MATKPLHPRRLSDKLYDDILRDIVGGVFREDDRLPTESELSKRFEVSRPVVREALARLKFDGLIRTARGSGTFVQRRPAATMLKFTPAGSIADIQRCFEFRASFEGEAAHFAAERRTSRDLEAMKTALDALEAAVQAGVLGQEEDIEFHRAVTKATQNQYFESVSDMIAHFTAAGIQMMRTLSLERPVDRLLLVQAEHLEIYESILNGDPPRARGAMRQHITNARRRMFEGMS